MSPSAVPVIRLAVILGLIALLVLLSSSWLVRPAVVLGGSMEPALTHGDRLLVDLWTYRQRAPHTGEIVWLDGPLPGELPLIKRAATGPGFPADRPRPGNWPGGMTVGERGIWVVGDNPRESGDSRSFGSVPRRRIRGRAFWRYWPPSRAGRIPR